MLNDDNERRPAGCRASQPPVFRTVESLAEVPGGDEAALAEVGRRQSVRHGVRFVVLDDEAQAVSGTTAATGGANDSAVGRAAA
jgi:hypothetical protein